MIGGGKVHYLYIVIFALLNIQFKSMYIVQYSNVQYRGMQSILKEWELEFLKFQFVPKMYTNHPSEVSLLLDLKQIMKGIKTFKRYPLNTVYSV